MRLEDSQTSVSETLRKERSPESDEKEMDRLNVITYTGIFPTASLKWVKASLKC